MKIRNILAIVSIFCHIAIASAYTVVGKVAGPDGESIPGATCLLYNLPDSIFVAGTATDADGAFRLSTESRTLLLKISSIGFEDRNLDVSIPEESAQENPFSLGEIRLNPHGTELAEVSVKARKPQLRITNGILNYDIDEMLRNNSYTSAHGLLSDLPLLISHDGKSLNLSGAPNGSQIYINGRKPTMSQQDVIEYLRALPANQILNVEIVYLPGPEWGSSMSVINVKLRKQSNHTLTGRLNVDYTHSTGNYFNPSASLIYGRPKISTYFMYYYGLSDRYKTSRQTGIHKINGVGEYDVAEDHYTKTKYHYHYAYGNIKYDPDANNSFEIFYHGRFTPSNSVKKRYLSNLFGEESSMTDKHGHTNSVGITYNYKEMLNFYAAWSGTHNESDMDLLNVSAGNESGEESSLGKITDSDSFSANLKLNHKLPKGWDLYYGVTVIYDQRKGEQRYRGPSDLTSGFDFNSDYKDKDFWTVGYAGVSKELIKSKLYAAPSLSVVYMETGQDKRTEIHPYLNMTYYVSPSNIFQFTFQSSNNTPTLAQLAETVSFSDSYSISMGNPYLKQGRIYLEQLVYILKNKYVLRFFGVQRRNNIVDIPYQSPYILKQISQPCNMSSWNVYGFGWSLPIEFGIYSMNLNGEVGKARYKWDWHDIYVDKRIWDFNVDASNRFKILKDPSLVGYLNLSYAVPKSQYGVVRASHYFNVNTGFSMSLLKDALSIRAFVYDLFDMGTRRYQRIKLSGQNLGTYYPDCGRSFDITIAYAFKGYKRQNVRQVDTSNVGD